MLKHIKNIKSHSTDGVSKLWFTPINQYYTRELYTDTQPQLAKTFPIRLDFVNDEHSFEKYYRRRKASDVFAIELVLEGTMNFVQNSKKYIAKAGSVMLVHHGQNIEFATGTNGHCHHLACVLSGHELNGLLHTTKLIEHDVVKLHNLETIENTMRKCFNEMKEKKSVSDGVLQFYHTNYS